MWSVDAGRGSGGVMTWVVGAAVVGLVFDRGLWCVFFFGVDGRLWVVGGGGGIRCV